MCEDSRDPADETARGRIVSDAPCRFLDWDSEFFGRRIGQVNGVRITAARLAEIEDWARDHAIDCLYFLADAEHHATQQLAVQRGFDLVDTRVTYERDIYRPSIPEHPGITIRDGRQSDLPNLAEVSGSSHRISRFWFDPRFPDEDCERLYRVWLEKSLSGYADRTFVAEVEGQAVGFMTCDIERSSKTGWLVLSSIRREMRGRGIGKLFVDYPMQWFATEGCERASVVTQARNLVAQRLWQRFGFMLVDVKLWFHCWFDR